jgi:hypothetical protein
MRAPLVKVRNIIGQNPPQVSSDLRQPENQRTQRSPQTPIGIAQPWPTVPTVPTLKDQ